MSDYPEHEKLKKISDKSQAIGEFLDWLGYEKSAHIMTYRTDTYTELCPGEMFHSCVGGMQATYYDEDTPSAVTCKRCAGSGRVEIQHEGWKHVVTNGFSRLLAEYFDIDENKIEAEKRAMLESIRANS